MISAAEYFLSANCTSPNQLLLPLTSSINDKAHLQIGGCDVVEIVAQFDTPLYIVDAQGVRTACQQFMQGLANNYPGQTGVLYASKAWSNKAILSLITKQGLGVEVVSEGELQTALAIGATNIYFHGNNKAKREIQLAINNNVVIVVEHKDEIDLIMHLAMAQPALPRPRIMLRITPEISAHTHAYIQTGKIDSKFGFLLGEVEGIYKFLAAQNIVDVIGVHAHIGSQILDTTTHAALADILVRLFAQGVAAGLNLREINIGGGLGAKYVPHDMPVSITTWAASLATLVKQACINNNINFPKLLCEPGRAIIASSCVTAYSVGSTKIIPQVRTYVSVDGGMSDNPRPITYQAKHIALLANDIARPFSHKVTIAGKHCESGDCLINDISFPEARCGDILIIPCTGAYNASMASNYNRVPRCAAVLIDNGKAHLIMKRETIEEVLQRDCLPTYMSI